MSENIEFIRAQYEGMLAAANNIIDGLGVENDRMRAALTAADGYLDRGLYEMARNVTRAAIAETPITPDEAHTATNRIRADECEQVMAVAKGAITDLMAAALDAGLINRREGLRDALDVVNEIAAARKGGVL
ncbi:hypothetical protein ACTTAI_16255 [Rhodobacter capsulatus]|uniref:hypothetical protein n=1 Tax=Rhodobacter capsulatus TaxID=1061 RepID=UPI00402A5465